jgi:hypothetical protein
VYHTTGFSRDEVIDLCVLINSAERGPDFVRWPPVLGLFKSVAVALTYMRHNRTQAEIGESFGVSQPTISRTVKAITPLIAETLADYVPTADELDAGAQYIVDGTLLPCWSWANTTYLRVRSLWRGCDLCFRGLLETGGTPGRRLGVESSAYHGSPLCVLIRLLLLMQAV